MLAGSVPSKFSVPFASAAVPGVNVRPIPVNPPAQAGAASLSQGFPPLNFTPVAAGGIPPFGQDMNGILQQVTSWLQWHQAGGPIVYDAAFAASIGGYPRGALIQSTSGHAVYESLADGNLTDPNSGSASWRVAFSPWSTQSWPTAGSANAQTITLSPSPASLAQLTGIQVNFFSQGTNTGAVTLNVNGLGNVALVQSNGALLSAGALVSGGPYAFVYSGSRFVLVSQVNVFTDTGGVGLAVNGSTNAASGANLALIGNGGTTPNKFIRAFSGLLQVMNSAYTTVIAGLSDSGALSLAGGLTAAGPVAATSGNITATAGRLRAALGAFGSGDAQAATLLGDFTRTINVGNDDYIFEKFPDGTVIQCFHGNSITGQDFVPFPIAFPTACSQVLVNEASPQGWTSTGTPLPTIFGTQQLSQGQFALYVLRYVPGGTWIYTGGISYRYIAIGY